MNFLVIDTSLSGLTLGLASVDGSSYKILETYGSSHPQEAAARLPELCMSLLAKRHLKITDLGGLLVSHGPGSFTGIKIGLSFVLGWQRAGTPLKIWGVSSFKGLLRMIPAATSLALPATQTAGYFTRRSEKNNLGENLNGSEVGVFDIALPGLSSLVDEKTQKHYKVEAAQLAPIHILGRWPKIEEWLSAQKIEWITAKTDEIHIEVVAGMIEEFIANSERLSEGKLIPVYLRKSAPEEKLDNLAASQANSKQD